MFFLICFYIIYVSHNIFRWMIFFSIFFSIMSNSCQDLDETDLGGQVTWQTNDDRLVQNYVPWENPGGPVTTSKNPGACNSNKKIDIVHYCPTWSKRTEHVFGMIQFSLCFYMFSRSLKSTSKKIRWKTVCSTAKLAGAKNCLNVRTCSKLSWQLTGTNHCCWKLGKMRKAHWYFCWETPILRRYLGINE